MNHIELGQRGEVIALNHLLTKGHQLVETNFKFKKSEIDIVTKNNGLLVVTEVKTRNSTALGAPHSSITRSKQRQIIKVANHFIETRGIEGEVRFDVISIILNKNEMHLEHIEDAFYPLG
jgi:putative endonuclease